ncbi:MAG: citrate/2-methylcitrate synthase, partial [Woeseia sp.]
MSKDAYTLTRNDGSGSTELPIHKGTMGPDVVNISSLYQQEGVFTYDPGYGATGSCESKITFIDGQKGVLLYRGYPVEQLAAKSNFMEISYLLLYGELPSKEQLARFDTSIRTHTMLNEGMLRFFTGFRYDAH